MFMSGWPVIHLPAWCRLITAYAGAAKSQPAAYDFQDLLKDIVTAATGKLPFNHKHIFKVSDEPPN